MVNALVLITDYNIRMNYIQSGKEELRAAKM